MENQPDQWYKLALRLKDAVYATRGNGCARVTAQLIAHKGQLLGWNVETTTYEPRADGEAIADVLIVTLAEGGAQALTE